MEAATPAIPTLNYTTSRPWYRRLLRIALVCAALVLAIACLIWRKPITTKASLLYHQQQCMNYTAPPDQVVFEEDPALWPALQANGYQSFTPTHRWSKPAVFYNPPCWQSFAKNLAGGGLVNEPVLFVHELTSASGVRRLVYVKLACDGRFTLDTGVLDPAGLFTAPKFVLPGFINFRQDFAANPRKGLIRFYAGQPNNDDPAIFSIRYKYNGQSGEIAGRLSDAGDQVLLRYPRVATWRTDGFFSLQLPELQQLPVQEPFIQRPQWWGTLLAEPPAR